MKRIRVEATKTPGVKLSSGVRIVDAETGDLITGIQSFRIEGQAGDLVKLYLEVIDFDFDVESYLVSAEAVEDDQAKD